MVEPSSAMKALCAAPAGTPRKRDLERLGDRGGTRGRVSVARSVPMRREIFASSWVTVVGLMILPAIFDPLPAGVTARSMM